MQLKLQTLLFLTLSCFSLLTIADTSFQAPLATSSKILDLTSDGHTVVAVGERGHILLSTAASNTAYSQVVVPTKATLTAIANVGNAMWAVGHDATILYSNDSGMSWNVQYSNPSLERPFLDVIFTSSKEGFAVGAYGLFYRTIDGGKNWVAEQHIEVLTPADVDYLNSVREEDESFYQEELSFILPHFNRIRYANGQLLLSGEAGLLAVSNDKGHSWRRIDIDYQGSFFDFKKISSGDYLAVGLRGNLFASSNLNDWHLISTCVSTSLNAVVDVPETNNVIIVGNNGVILSLNSDVLILGDNKSSVGSCAANVAIKLLDSQSDDTISDAIIVQKHIMIATTSGVKQVELE